MPPLPSCFEAAFQRYAITQPLPPLAPLFSLFFIFFFFSIFSEIELLLHEILLLPLLPIITFFAIIFDRPFLSFIFHSADYFHAIIFERLADYAFFDWPFELLMRPFSLSSFIEPLRFQH
jgi:hypothetical protein